MFAITTVACFCKNRMACIQSFSTQHDTCDNNNHAEGENGSPFAVTHALYISGTNNAGQRAQRKERNNSNNYDSNAVMITSVVHTRGQMTAKQILSEAIVLLAPYRRVQ